MPDLLYVLNELTDVQGNILIPGINDGVEPLSEKEIKLYEKINFGVDAHINEIGVSKPLKTTKVSTYFFNSN